MKNINDLKKKLTESVFHEDCLETMKRNINYDYVITSPPDYQELYLEPFKDDEKYIDYLKVRLKNLKPKNGVITLVVSNRQYKEKMVMKHKIITDMMIDLGYLLLNEKIWIRTKKVSKHLDSYSFVMSFGKKESKSNNSKSFLEDVWEDKIDIKNKNYRYQFSRGLVKRCLENFTDENDMVFDCFSGIMTTAIGCIETNRRYLMSEIGKFEYYEGWKRICIKEAYNKK